MQVASQSSAISQANIRHQCQVQVAMYKRFVEAADYCLTDLERHGASTGDCGCWAALHVCVDGVHCDRQVLGVADDHLT
jgi:hypothetical protein